MRTVNSSAYAPRCKIESLDHGIMMLGRANLERIVMMLGAQSVVPSKVPRTLDVRAFWKTSAKRAVLAKGIADLVIPAQASLSFTAGLLFIGAQLRAETNRRAPRNLPPAERAADLKRWAASHERGPGLPDSAIGRDAIYE